METETRIEEGLEDGRQKCWRRQREIEGRRWAARAREITENYGEMETKAVGWLSLWRVVACVSALLGH